MSLAILANILIISLFILIEIKAILFWIYLWQLKNYHIGRFKDHFSTTKGKNIFLNYFFIASVLSVLLFNLNGIFYFIPLLLIIVQGFLILPNMMKRSIITPTFTKKTIFLFLINIIIFSLIGILSFNLANNILHLSFYLLILIVLTPLLTSLIILTLQPLTVLLRNIKINKAKNKRKTLKNLIVIGITGSYGKTSTKEFLYTILSSKFENVKKTFKNENSEIGISNFILNKLTQNDKYFICEMGAYNKKGIQLLCNIANPQIGILTGVNNQHLATFGSQEIIVKTKFELINHVKSFSVVNWDNYLIKNFKTEKNNIYKSSYKEKQDIYAENIKIFKDHLEFNVIINNEKELFHVPVLGQQSISNILTASFVAHKLGMTLKEIAQAVKNIKPEFGGMVKRKNFLDATYSSNANAVIAHLNFLKEWNGKKIIIMPCLIELGHESKRIHKEIGEKIKEVCDLAIITTLDQFQEIKKTAGDKAIYSNNPNEILNMLKKYDSSEDIILLESRVPKEIIKYSKK